MSAPPSYLKALCAIANPLSFREGRAEAPSYLKTTGAGQEPKYAPNEPELKVSGLEAHYDGLNLKNEEARTAGEALDDARKDRDRLLYAEDTGLVSLAADVKDYVWSVYGPSSREYKRISAIPFRR